MKAPRFTISGEIFQRFPKYVRGVVALGATVQAPPA